MIQEYDEKGHTVKIRKTLRKDRVIQKDLPEDHSLTLPWIHGNGNVSL